MIALDRANLVCELARSAGFERAGIAPASPTARAAYLEEWLAKGFAGEMDYLGRWRELRADPRRLLPGARSVIVVAHVYGHAEGPGFGVRGSDRRDGGTERHGEGDRSPAGRVAQYAWGRDYHKVIRRKLHRLVDEMRRRIAEPFEARVCVDTAPLVERELAAAAGIGWIGKNTMVLNQKLGSFFFLGEVITTLDLTPSIPAIDHCGTCARCLEACPTGALIAPYQMDARRCISYLTIEYRSEIPSTLRPLMGDWLYGCDVCQDVCPHNHKVPVTREPAYETGKNPFVPTADLAAVGAMTPAEYQQSLAGSAMKRASLEMLKRNAAAVRGNFGFRVAR